MKVSYQWLNHYLPLEENGINPTELAEKIARSSVDINDVYSPQNGLKKVVVGLVESVRDHPQADHLHIAQVKIADDTTVQIVCGAPNLKAGKKVITALKGAKLADGTKIRKSKLRGEESNGMLCALQEIGFTDKVAPKAYEEGLWYLPDDAKVGAPVFSYLGMDDTIIDTDVTPNRGDMLSIYGNVNDLAAIYDLKNSFTSHAVVENSSEKTADLISATVEDQDVAPTYKMRVIKNVQIQDSPLWLQIRLWNAGIRPINNVVDVTNYILIKYGQPLHSFDYDKLANHKIKVRHAKEGEKFTTLDGEEQQLKTQDILVCDGERPAALAGTMGGEETKVTNQTVNVALEAAIFDPVMVRKQARRLDLHSESSMRFERGINPETVEVALNEAAYWLSELAGGEVTKGIVTATEAPANSTPIELSTSKVNAVLGLTLSQEDLVEIFDRLKFDVQKENDDQLTVYAPARRWDISIKADLYEEIARIYGYDNIPSTLPAGTRTLGGLNERQRFLKASRHVMQGVGLNQAISYSLLTKEQAAQFQVNNQDGEPMMLDYPMSSDHVATRMNIVAGLLIDIAYNVARQVGNVALYEQGRVFLPEDGQERPTEEEHVAGAVTGSLTAASWNQEDDDNQADFFTVKGIVERYLHNMAVEGEISYQANHNRADLHPGRCADVLLDGQVVGYIGQVHPTVAKQYRVPVTYVFELNLEPLLSADKRDKHYDLISKYPAITRDVAISVDQDVTNAQIVAVIKEIGGSYLKAVRLFDLYKGNFLPANKKSMAYTLTYQDDQGTLTEDQVNAAFEKVVEHLKQEVGAEIR